MKTEMAGGTETPNPVAGDGMRRMLTVQELATILRCSPKTVYRLADAGKMPAPCRLGTLVRWSNSAIEAWVAAGCPSHRNAPGR